MQRLIDSYNLIKTFTDKYRCRYNFESLDWGTVRNVIREQPEINTRLSTKWVIDEYNQNCEAECNCCGEAIPEELVHKYNYCPYCGCSVTGIINNEDREKVGLKNETL